MKKKFAMICTAALVITLTGCSGNKNVESNADAVSSSVEAETDDLSARSEDSTVEAGNNENSKEEQDSETSQNSDKKDMALGQITSIDGDTITLTLGEMQIGEAPSDDRPGKSGGAEVPFTASDETLSITFDGSVTIQIMEDGQLSEGSIEDLAVDDILSIAYDEEGVVVSVQVMSQSDAPAPPDESSVTDTES